MVVVWLTFVVLVLAAYFVLRRLIVNRRSLDRLFTDTVDSTANQAEGDSIVHGFLRRWLYLAGYRQPSAPAVFVSAMLLALGIGVTAAFVIMQLGLSAELHARIARLPPGVADLMVPIIYLMPWTLSLMLLAIPWLVVRQARRQRVEKVEIDLPISLELLATLGEAGLGFDAALARVLDSVTEDRPLGREFRSYQSDLLAGRTRVEALRRLANRLEVPAVTILTSALVQAEQMGSGIAKALRRQADELRDRRRERATAFAMSLPIKRMFPLVICFMPGIFVWTLGPFFVQLIQFADTFIRVRNF
jgi:tight adherence protein C